VWVALLDKYAKFARHAYVANLHYYHLGKATVDVRNFSLLRPTLVALQGVFASIPLGLTAPWLFGV
jgi:hypothetical protein